MKRPALYTRHASPRISNGTGGTPSSASAAHEKVHGEAFLEKQRG